MNAPTRIAVDLGTTWTTAAVASGTDRRVLDLGDRGSAMPSTVAIDDQGSVVVGRAALAIMATKPERGVREIKRRFGDTAPILLGGAPWSADALTAAVLRGVLASEDHASMELILTHPANWGDFKLDLLRNVAHQAGHERVTLMPEPVAAARHYVASGRLRDGEAIAVYDFGGGTFDAAVLRLDGHGATVLASQGLERLGGIDIDQVVFSHVIEAIGAGADGLDREDPAVLAALAHLRMECTAAKEQLSADSEVTVDVGLPGLTTRIRITRTEFEDALRPRLAETVAAMDRALGSAGVVPGDLAGVVLVGGSSRIPLVSEMLASHFDRPLLVDADAKLALVEGAVMNVSTTPSLPAVGVGPVALADPPAQLPPPAGAVTRGPAASAPPPPPPAAPSRRSGRVVAGAAAAATLAATAVGVLYGDEMVDAVSGGHPDGSMAASMDAFDLIGHATPAEPGAGDHRPMAFAAPGAGPEHALMAPPRGFAPPAPPVGLGFAAPQPQPQHRTPQHHAQSQHHQPQHHAQPQHHQPQQDDDQPQHHQLPPDAAAHDQPQRHDPLGDDQHQRPTDSHDPTPTETGHAGDEGFEHTRQQLLERIGHLDLGQGASAEQTDALRHELGVLVEHWQPASGQSAADALAELRTEYQQHIHDFTQDRKIDALIAEQQRDNAQPDQHGGLHDHFDDLIDHGIVPPHVDPLGLPESAVHPTDQSVDHPAPSDPSMHPGHDVLGLPVAEPAPVEAHHELVADSEAPADPTADHQPVMDHPAPSTDDDPMAEHHPVADDDPGPDHDPIGDHHPIIDHEILTDHDPGAHEMSVHDVSAMDHESANAGMDDLRELDDDY